MADKKKKQKKEQCVECDEENGTCEPIDCEELLEKTRG